MPTEVTTAASQSNRPAVKPARVQVTDGNSVRQDLSDSEQVVPSVKDAGTSTNLKDISQKVDNLNNFSQSLKRDLQFSVDSESGRTIIRVIDSETQELIRVIPPEEVSVVAKSFQGQVGVLLKASV